MIIINYSPVRSTNDYLTVEWDSPRLIVSNEVFDLSELADGDYAEHEILKTASRSGDDYEVTLRLAYGPNAPELTRFPLPVIMVSNGSVSVPDYEES